MPELPEVETTRRGIEPHLKGKHVQQVIIRHRQLRWPVPSIIKTRLKDQKIKSITRRAKYILINTDAGTLIIHLGMSGSLRILPADTGAEKHDHFDLVLDSGKCLRLRDPRRFGAVLWTEADPNQHKLIKSLGPEPLEAGFNSKYLYQQSRQRKVSIKQFIMDSKIVVGVGNIYASEALFIAGIYPTRAAGKISSSEATALVAAIKRVLRAAIKQGGTTLRDFTRSDGAPGYFAQKLKVYGRAGEPCKKCGKSIQSKVIAQRNTYFCSSCQK